MSEMQQGTWTKPAAMAIPKGGYSKDKVEQGRYGPIFPKTPACYGFSIIAKIIPGREPVFYEYAKNIEKAVADQPDVLAVLKLHYLRWNLFDIKGDRYAGRLHRRVLFQRYLDCLFLCHFYPNISKARI